MDHAENFKRAMKMILKKHFRPFRRLFNASLSTARRQQRGARPPLRARSVSTARPTHALLISALDQRHRLHTSLPRSNSSARFSPSLPSVGHCPPHLFHRPLTLPDRGPAGAHPRGRFLGRYGTVRPGLPAKPATLVPGVCEEAAEKSGHVAF